MPIQLMIRDLPLLRRLDDDPQIDHLAQVDLMNRCVSSSPLAIFGAWVATVFIVFVTYPLVDSRQILLWFLLKSAVYLARGAAVYAYHRDTTKSERLKFWWLWLNGLLFIDGVTYGVGAILILSTTNIAVWVSMMLIFVLIAAFSMTTQRWDWRAYLLYATPIVLPMGLYLLSRGDPFGVVTGCAAGVGLAFMGVVVKRANQEMIESIVLRYKAERLAKERTQALEESARLGSVKSHFIATMSHELRSPLHGILGMGQLARLEANTEQAASRLDSILAASQSLLETIDDILDFSDLEVGKLRLQCAGFDLRRLVFDVAELARRTAASKSLRLEVACQLADSEPVFGDARRLRQVLLNLVGNAVKFTSQGGVSLTVRRPSPASPMVEFEVSDTGIGMDEKTMAALFHAFVQGDESFYRRYGGTGLGLALSRDIARRMGGDLVCSSVVGQGSTFSLSVQLPMDPKPAKMGDDDQEVPQLESVFAGLRVCVAEDDGVNAMLLREILEVLHATVDVVGDGRGAVRSAMATPRPDLVLMDCNMPEMDGFEATRLIRDYERSAGLPAVPIVAVTAMAQGADVVRCLEAGMDAHVAKPFDSNTLESKVRQVLTGRTPSAPT